MPWTTLVNTRFDNPIQVQVVDAAGRGIPGQVVNFAREAGAPPVATALFNGAATWISMVINGTSSIATGPLSFVSACRIVSRPSAAAPGQQRWEPEVPWIYRSC